MIVYDVNHQEMMFKVTNKLQKHSKHTFFDIFQKNVENNFGPIQNTLKNTAKKNLISKKIQLSILNGF